MDFMKLIELNRDQTNYTRSTPKVQASSGDALAKNRQHLFQSSALYHRNMWLNEKHQPFEQVSNPLTQNQSSDFFGQNICFGNTQLIQKMEDTMQELIEMKKEWLAYGMVHYKGETRLIADFNANVSEKEFGDGKMIQIVSYDQATGSLMHLFQDGLIKIKKPQEHDINIMRINQQTRTKYGFSMVEVTKINFTLSNNFDEEKDVNPNWTPGQSITLDFLSYPDDFDGALEQNIFSVRFERVMNSSSISSSTPCLITLLKRSQTEFFIMDAITFSENINFCQQYEAASEYGDKVGFHNKEKKIFTFQRDIEVQLGIVPIARMNQSNAIQILLQINGVDIFSEVLDLQMLGIGKRQLYYTRLRSSQDIDLTKVYDQAHEHGKNKERALTHGPFKIKNIRFFKARTFFVSGSVNANPPAFFKNDPWENHFRIYFSLLDACKQPSGYLFYPDNDAVYNELAEAKRRRGEKAVESHGDWRDKIQIFLMESSQAMISHCSYRIPEQRIYDLQDSIILDHNQFYGDFWCKKYNPGHAFDLQDFQEIYVYLQITHTPAKPMFLETVPAPLIIKNYRDFKDRLAQDDNLKDLYIIQIDNSDINTGFIKSSAIVNDIYHFRVRTLQPLISVDDKNQNIEYQSFLQTDTQRFTMSKMKKIDPTTLDIKVISHTANFNFTSESIELNVIYKCTINSNKQDCFDNDPTKLKELYDDFIISFVPVSSGTYSIVSQHFMSNRRFMINVISQKYGKTDEQEIRSQISSLFSNALIRRSRTGEIVDEIVVGEQIEIHIDLRNQLNNSLPSYLLEQIYAQCNLHTESYYVVKDKSYKFQHFTTQQEELHKDIRFNSPGLNTVITASGIAQLFIMLNCPRENYNFQISCGRSDQIVGEHNKGNQCQLQVQAHVKNKIYNNITVSVPLYPYDKVRLMDAVDNSLTYYKGDNLVFDVTVNDIYGNKINAEDGLAFSASFSYSQNAQQSATMEFKRIYHEGIMSFQLSDADNIKFKTFPIRGGTTSYKINLSYSAACQNGQTLKLLMPVKLISSDWIEPMNFVMPNQGDVADGLLSTVVFDKIFQAGKPGRAYVTLRNSRFQQLSEYPANLETDFVVKLEKVGADTDEDGKLVVHHETLLPNKICSVIKRNGIYTGEIFVWITCTKAEMLIALSIFYKEVPLEPQRRQFYVVQASNRYKIQFFKPSNFQPGGPTYPKDSAKENGTIYINSSEQDSSGTFLAFNIADSEDNQVDSILVQRNDPQYGQMIYRIMNEDGTEAYRNHIIFYGNLKQDSENVCKDNKCNCQIFINRINVGKYRLVIEVPGDVDHTYDLVVTSDSQILSMNQRYQSFRTERELFKQGQFDENIAPYSGAFRADDTWSPSTPARREGETITIPDDKAGYEAWVYFIPRNIYNSTFPYDASGDDVALYNTKQQKQTEEHSISAVSSSVKYNYQRDFITVSMTHVESGVKTYLERDDVESQKQTESAKYTIQVFRPAKENGPHTAITFTPPPTTSTNTAAFLNKGTIVQNGMYQITAKSKDWLQGSLLVQGGTFRVKTTSETPWPSTRDQKDDNRINLANIWQYIKYNRMFIAKGPQKNLRQTHQPLPAYPTGAPYGYPTTSCGSSCDGENAAAEPIACPFYDFATDSILMFKTLLRDEYQMPFKKKEGQEFKVQLFEIKSQANRLAMAAGDPKKTEFRTIYNQETGELTSFPTAGQELKTSDLQQAAEDYPSYYVVELTVDDITKSSASQAKHLGLWTLAVTDTSAVGAGSGLSFLSPNSVQFQAGNPHSFLAELRQTPVDAEEKSKVTKHQKTLKHGIGSQGKGNIQEVEITQVTECGRLNYVSIYQNKAGAYNLPQTATLSTANTIITQTQNTRVLVAPGDLAYIDIIQFQYSYHEYSASSTDFEKLQAAIEADANGASSFHGSSGTSKGFPVRAKMSIVYELYDGYANIIGPYTADRDANHENYAEDFEEWQRFFELQYTPEYVQTFLSFKHEDDRNDVKVETERFGNANLGNQFVTHFTVFQQGNVAIQSPLFKDKSEYKVEFVTDASLNISPSFDKSFVQPTKNIITEAEGMVIHVIIEDPDGNRMDSQQLHDNGVQIITNIVPIESCNVSTYVTTDYDHQGVDDELSKSSVFLVKVNKTALKPCVYKIKVYWVRQNQQTQLSCSGCELVVEPGAANVTDVKFFDLLRKQTIDSYIGNDISKHYRKIVLLGQLQRHVIPFYQLDRGWNLIRKPSQLGEPQASIRFSAGDECTPALSISRDSEATPASLLSMMELDWRSQAVADKCVISQNTGTITFWFGNDAKKPTGRTVVINIAIVDDTLSKNYLDYSVDKTNTISSVTTIIQLLNTVQNELVVPSAIPSFEQGCMLKNQFPILGLIDVRNEIGLRKNISLEDVTGEGKGIISINFGPFNHIPHHFTLYPGPEGNGTFLFALYLDQVNQPGNDYIQKEAFIVFTQTVKNITLVNSPIRLHCLENKDVINNLVKLNGENYTTIADREIKHGDTTCKSLCVPVGTPINITLQSRWEERAIDNYPADVVIEPSNDKFKIRSAPSDVVIESVEPSLVTYIFEKGVETAGEHRIILASSLPASATMYLFTAVEQSAISPGKSYFDVSISERSTAAGGQTKLYIHLRDEFKNEIAKSNINLDDFVVSYSNTKTAITGDYYILREEKLKKQQIILPVKDGCSVPDNGIMECTVVLQILGFWQFRVEYQGIRLEARNQYALVNQLGAVDLTKSLMLPMSFNVYEPYYKPQFGMSQFLKASLETSQGACCPKFKQQIIYKILLRDSYGNPWLRPTVQYTESSASSQTPTTFVSSLQARINPEVLDVAKRDPATGLPYDPKRMTQQQYEFLEMETKLMFSSSVTNRASPLYNRQTAPEVKIEDLAPMYIINTPHIQNLSQSAGEASVFVHVTNNIEIQVGDALPSATKDSDGKYVVPVSCGLCSCTQSKRCIIENVYIEPPQAVYPEQTDARVLGTPVHTVRFDHSFYTTGTEDGGKLVTLAANNIIGGSQVNFIEVLTELGWSAQSFSMMEHGGLQLVLDEKRQKLTVHENMLILTTNFDNLEPVPFQATVNKTKIANKKVVVGDEISATWDVRMKVSSYKVARVSYDMSNYRAIKVKKFDKYNNELDPQGTDELFNIKLLYKSLIDDPDFSYDVKNKILTINALNGIYHESVITQFRLIDSFGAVEEIEIQNVDQDQFNQTFSSFKIDKHFIRLNYDEQNTGFQVELFRFNSTTTTPYQDHMKTPEIVGYTQQINFKDSADFKTIKSDFDWPSDYYAVQWTAKIQIEEGGAYTFKTVVNDYSLIMINGQKVVENGQGNVTLSAGWHDFSATFYQYAAGNARMEVTYKGPDTDNKEIYLSAKKGQGYAGTANQEQPENVTLSILALNKYGASINLPAENKFRIRIIYCDGQGLSDFDIVQSTYMKSRSFDYKFAPVKIGYYLIKIYVDSMCGLSLVHSKADNFVFSSLVIVQRSNQPLSSQNLKPQFYLVSKYHAMNYHFHYESTFVVVYLHDKYSNRIDQTIEPYVDKSLVANNQIQVNGHTILFLEPQMYAFFQSLKEVGGGTEQASFLTSSDFQAVTLVKIKGSSKQISFAQDFRARSINPFYAYLFKFHSYFPVYVQKAIAKISSFEWSSTTLVMTNNFSETSELVLMNPKEIQFNFDTGVQVSYGWISLSPAAIIEALGDDYDAKTMDINQISVPFNAVSVDKYVISPTTTDLQIIKLANNNIFRIRSEVKDDFNGITKQSKYDIKIEIGSKTQEYKNISLNTHKRLELFTEFENPITEKSINWDSKLRLDFNFSQETALQEGFNFDYLKRARIVVIRNRFTYLTREQFRLINIAKPGVEQQQWQLEIYLNGERDTYQSLEVYYQLQNGQLKQLLGHGVTFFKLPEYNISQIVFNPDDSELRVEFRDKLLDENVRNKFLIGTDASLIVYLFDKKHQICLPISVENLEYQANEYVQYQITGVTHRENSFSVCTQFIDILIFSNKPMNETMTIHYIDKDNQIDKEKKFNIESVASPFNKLNIAEIYIYGDTKFYKEIEKEQFVTEGEVMYMYLYSTSFQRYLNQIDIQFLNNRYVNGRDYDMTYNYNDLSKLYIIILKFGIHGDFDLGRLSINQQIIKKYEGYKIKIILSECRKIKLMQKNNFDQIISGQNLTMIFSCLDKNNNPISVDDSDPMDVVDYLSFIIITNDTLLNFYSGKVRLFSQMPSLFIIQETMVVVGKYSLSIYYQNGHMKQKKLVHQIWDKIHVISGTCDNKDWQRCPNDPRICAPDYFTCQMIVKEGNPNYPAEPFQCKDDVDPSNKQMIFRQNTNDCCTINVKHLFEYKWCSSQGKCLKATEVCCDWNPQNNIRCNKQSQLQNKEVCVTNQFECCEDLTFQEFDILGIEKKSLVKCSHEDKCVPEDSDQYCFEPFDVNCKQVLGLEFLDTGLSKSSKQCDCWDTSEDCGFCQCQKDGKCKTIGNHCPNSHVCPLGYTQCPDGSCQIGNNSFDQCVDWSKRQNICELSMYDNNVTSFIHCPGSYSQCATSYEECPSQIVCNDPNQIICPDGMCRNSTSQCNFPSNTVIKNSTSFHCNDANQYQCPGTDICAQKKQYCPNSKIASYVPRKTCPVDYQLCESGKCAYDCFLQTMQDLNINTTTSILNMVTLAQQDGAYYDDGINNDLILCPQSNELRRQISDCPSLKLCASNWRFNYGPVQKKICQGIQKCVDDVDECDYSYCDIPYVLSYSQNLTNQHFTICHDGKCAYSQRKVSGILPDICMTPFSCSDYYFKVDTSVGEFCFDQQTLSSNDSNNNLVNQITFIAHMLGQYKCDPKQIKCLSGLCVNDIEQCPTAISCPHKTHPHRCQDGSCVKFINLCSNIDNQVLTQLKRCTSFGLLLCQSDLITCVTNLYNCPKSKLLPTKCQKFQVKCWDGQCVYHIDECPNLSKDHLSSCHSKIGPYDKLVFKDPVHYIQCPLLETCENYLQNCSEGQIIQSQYWSNSSSLTKQEPIKCKYQCEAGCLDKPCPEWLICPNGFHNISIRCWNGECVNDPNYCMKKLDGKGCLYEDQFCYNDYAIQCLNSYPNFIEGQLQPPDQCYVPRCPPNKPIKCPNGLCVTNQLSCAAVPFSKIDIGYCFGYNQQLKSKFGNVNRFVPCGNGKCVSEVSQCLPLVECEDIDPNLKFRCHYDATCKKTLKECTRPKVTNQDGSRQQYCPYHIPYLCNSGECAKTVDYCTQWYNGCPRGRPHKCEFSGLCVKYLRECSDFPVSTEIKSQINDLIKSRDQYMIFIEQILNQITNEDGTLSEDQLKNKAPKESPINFCKEGEYLCNVNRNVQEYVCVDDLQKCINYKTGCPVNTPIKCVGADNSVKCYNHQKFCLKKGLPQQNDGEIGTLKYVPNKQTLQNGCEIQNNVRCNWIHGKTFSCKKTPYMQNDYIYDEEFVDMHSCYPTLFQSKQAEMALKNPQFKNQLVNICQTQQYPISCQSGKCVADINQCGTCKAGCQNSINHQCVADQELCFKNEFISISEQTDYVKPSKFCPQNQPVRCITDGLCVGSALDCVVTKSDLNSLRDTRFELINPLISAKCSSNKPISCVTGICAKDLNDCINDKRQQLVPGFEGDMTLNVQFKEALQKPKPIMLLEYSTAIIRFVSQHSYKLNVKPNPCAVICQDGSCRDNQLDCPQIQACPSPMIIDHNIRCRNGFCQNENTCKIIESCNGLTQRCEDGSCRESCLEFYGCPIDSPFMCQDGSCGGHSLDCFDLLCNIRGSEEQKIGNKTRCRNGDCITNSTGLLCPQSIPLYQYQVKQIQYSVNVLLNNTIQFLYDIDQNTIGELIIPSGALPVVQHNYKKQIFTNYIQRFVLTGIPDSVLKDMKNLIVDTRVEEFEKDYQPLETVPKKLDNKHSSTKYLLPKYSLLAPVVNIENLDEEIQESDLNGQIKRTSFAQAVYLKFKIDVDQFPKSLNYSLDSCLGIKQDDLWLCIGRDSNLTLTSYNNVTNTTLITYPIYQPGIYAYIINPQPNVQEKFQDSMISFVILRNTRQFLILVNVTILFGVIILICGVFILNEKRRQVAQQIDVDHDLKGEKHQNIVKDLLKSTGGLDKKKLIENLITRIRKTETQRSKIKTTKKKFESKVKQQLIKQQQMIDRIKKMKAQAANDESIDIEDELLNDDYLNDDISAYAISINVKNKQSRHGKDSSVGIEGVTNQDNENTEEDGIVHYDEDEEEQKVDMYKLAKQYTKSVTKPQKEKEKKNYSADIMKLQKKALLTSISNFQKQVGVEKRDTKAIRQSIDTKLGFKADPNDKVNIINSVDKKKKFFKVKSDPESTQNMNTKQLMDKVNNSILDKYLDKIDIHNSLLQGSIIDEQRSSDSGESELSDLEEIKEEEH